MPVWEEFEIQCTEYLNNRFGKYASFLHQGGSDSTVADILVNTKSNKSFYIEAKHSPAQCGQFVLLPNIETRTFEYSSLNATRINRYAEMIIEYMNDSFDYFREAGTTGIEIDMPNKQIIFADWIMTVYGEKGVRFFISNGYTNIPLELISEYFSITAKYRTKRSGSSPVGKLRINEVADAINSMDILISDIRTNGAKLIVVSPENLHDKRFILGKYEYMFSRRDSVFEVRQLSNTYNANVIFSVELFPGVSGLTDHDFILELN